MKITSFINNIIAITALCVVSYFALTRVDDYLKIKAVDECIRSATVKWTDPSNAAEITEPYKPAYEECLKTKGIK